MRLYLLRSLYVGVVGLDVAHHICKNAVSRSTNIANEWCMNQCDSLLENNQDPWESWNWTNSCVIAEGLDAPCFHNWIYGYSEPDSLASLVPPEVAETPALCQAFCQQVDDCVNWVWNIRTGGCKLKSSLMIRKALSFIMENSSSSEEVTFCSPDLPALCYSSNSCLICGQATRCVWSSAEHISGWRYCNPQDACNPVSQESTISTFTNGRNAGSRSPNLSSDSNDNRLSLIETRTLSVTIEPSQEREMIMRNCNLLDTTWIGSSNNVEGIFLRIDALENHQIQFTFEIDDTVTALKLRVFDNDCYHVKAYDLWSGPQETPTATQRVLEGLLSSFSGYHADNSSLLILNSKGDELHFINESIADATSAIDVL
eukprot:Gregarina_sp_Poly_1__1684@NODE_1432_length_4160_cov_258_183728_g950_i0_p1_GENE_NODE_1432_length_4160_cov_258_183728_g950_i0NODE_1432_length_4160_cov_258_183728_g950_i0_p1_ORF_typecomplete_len372_score44_44PAN_4/PF14295_6/1_1e04PAN_4/PF14295_6/0_00037PAN_4/PF14295_6/1_8e04_NODE_1432_length_4160_cov_258_183728_g950_i03071422